ncbi:uncharacterized protein LOC123557659 [Mercenaria mercenaria]|uniref:uncharacterized protein LOC123557659 n=1 Tax=Mercenaria mercenaria TaxID=6596 RepID=UPI00234EA777|nr:uncharacterized protein LOC123557659 [Mercenaria mercenaria]
MIRNFTVIQITILCLCLVISSKDADYLRLHREARILVLGAGMSGVSTAKALHDAGYKNILMLEATSRIGGRIKHERLGNYTVELGAMWIYGKGSNPVYNMAKRHNISYTDNFLDDWTVRDENGNDVTGAADIAYSKLQDALTNTSDLIHEAEDDFTVLAGLRNSDWSPKSEVDDVIETYLLDFETGMPPSTLSGKKLHLHDTFEDFRNYDMMAVKHETGFTDIVKGLLESFMSEEDSRLMFNNTVELIEHGDYSVRVYTDNGGMFEADFVVATFSLGVLQQREVQFSPPLPPKKQLAIDMFGFCRFTHIYIQFPHSFWDETMYILRASKIRGHFSCWQNMNTIYPGSNILQLSLFGDDATWVDRSTDDGVIQEVLDVLQSLYPNVNIPKPSGFKVSRWNTDPLTRGAFSYWPTGFTDENMKDLQAPVGRLFFAGEHLDPLHYGFVHGAYRSGQRTAEDLIQCIENPSKCVHHGHQMTKRLQCLDEAADGCISNGTSVLTSTFKIVSCLLVTVILYFTSIF